MKACLQLQQLFLFQRSSRENWLATKQTVFEITDRSVELEKVLVSLQIMIDSKNGDSDEKYRETKQ